MLGVPLEDAAKVPVHGERLHVERIIASGFSLGDVLPVRERNEQQQVRKPPKQLLSLNLSVLSILASPYSNIYVFLHLDQSVIVDILEVWPSIDLLCLVLVEWRLVRLSSFLLTVDALGKEGFGVFIHKTKCPIQVKK
eukprot:CAMPEP_0170562930 /NCGR_PEP_ID=MMETSP0211-20121228/63339_1 /TAXON_ID=311385 /ORGANISM="Pseudokeronopsis sp., Strain OXSARD2" /LENGTH=137 /DNA_ID=CAMNT_0010880485 /DNA_START=248 /DNA_END=661 /DNA_ORIENTATION=+